MPQACHGETVTVGSGVGMTGASVTGVTTGEEPGVAGVAGTSTGLPEPVGPGVTGATVGGEVRPPDGAKVGATGGVMVGEAWVGAAVTVVVVGVGVGWMLGQCTAVGAEDGLSTGAGVMGIP